MTSINVKDASGATVGVNLTVPGTAGTPSADVVTVQGATSMTALKVDPSTVTSPISAASLPLPTGAATAAKQPALGTAGTASADVISVQGIASMTALKTDGSAVTQPISATSLPLPTGASTAAKQPALGTAGTASSDVITVQGIASMTALKTDGSGVTQPVSGSITANIGTSGSLALDATLTGGTQKAQVRGGAKGTTSAADVTSTASGANHQPLDVVIYDTSGNPITSFGGSGGTASSFGSAFPATGTAIGASDGTNMQGLQVESSSNKNLKVGIFAGATQVGVSANGLACDVKALPALPAGTNSIGTVQPGNTANTTPWLVTAYDKQVTVNASYTRPANTTTYAAGQVLANSTTAATILTFASAVRANGSGGRITEAILRDGANQTLKLEAELWLFSTSITMQNDGAAFAPTNASVDNLLQIITFSAGSARVGNAAAGASGNVAYHGLFQNNGYFVAAAGDTSIYGVLVVRNAYVPVSAETLKVILTIEQDT